MRYHRPGERLPCRSSRLDTCCHAMTSARGLTRTGVPCVEGTRQRTASRRSRWLVTGSTYWPAPRLPSYERSPSRPTGSLSDIKRAGQQVFPRLRTHLEHQLTHQLTHQLPGHLVSSVDLQLIQDRSGTMVTGVAVRDTVCPAIHLPLGVQVRRQRHLEPHLHASLSTNPLTCPVHCVAARLVKNPAESNRDDVVRSRVSNIKPSCFTRKMLSKCTSFYSGTPYNRMKYCCKTQDESLCANKDLHVYKRSLSRKTLSCTSDLARHAMLPTCTDVRTGCQVCQGLQAPLCSPFHLSHWNEHNPAYGARTTFDKCATPSAACSCSSKVLRSYRSNLLNSRMSKVHRCLLTGSWTRSGKSVFARLMAHPHVRSVSRATSGNPACDDQHQQACTVPNMSPGRRSQ